MADTQKVLGQVIPTAGTLTTAYTVPGATSTVVSTLKVCNQGPATTFQVSIAVAGVADTPKQYVYYNVPLGFADSFSATEGWTLAATDVIRVSSVSGLVSFNVFGVEVT